MNMTNEVREKVDEIIEKSASPVIKHIESMLRRSLSEDEIKEMHQHLLAFHVLTSLMVSVI